MRYLYFKSLRIALICLFTGNQVLYAQNNTLKQCLDDLLKARQAIAKPPNQGGFVMFNNAYVDVQYKWEDCTKGHHIPPLSFKTLAGESYDTTSLAGKILVVNFWFMSCVPCREELPALNRLVENYKGKEVLFLGFSTDKADRLKPAFFEQNRFDFTIIPDASGIANSFHFAGYPTTYIVDKKGIIRDAWSGVGSDKLRPYYRAKAAIDNLLTTTDK